MLLNAGQVAAAAAALHLIKGRSTAGSVRNNSKHTRNARSTRFDCRRDDLYSTRIHSEAYTSNSAQFNLVISITMRATRCEEVVLQTVKYARVN
jgi:hypothetical protein